MSTLATTNSFEPSLKSNARLVYRQFRANVISELSISCSEIIDQYGLLFFLLSELQWAALPGITTLDAAGNAEIAAGYDIITPLVQPGNNNAVALEIYKNQRDERKIVKKAINDVTKKFINSLPPDDVSFLSDRGGMLGMMAVTLEQLFAHTEQKYATLNSSDFDKIFDNLKKPKASTQEYSDLAEVHRNLHLILAGANQVSTEYLKTQHFMHALKEDPAGKYATEIFIKNFPAIPDRTFDDLVDTVLIHAPTYVPTTALLGYTNAMATSSVSTVAAVTTKLDEAGLAALIAAHQKELAAMKRKNGTASTPAAEKNRGSTTPKHAAMKYCHKHGFQHSHIGSDCLVMVNNPQQYNATHLAAKDPTSPAGGNAAVKN
mmetsp:Transcript_3444/g.4921  ORF Transcript_3444/g.4921 Transcript_3444/m.4921 type:complete len:376 (+) Transcript_3444:400-1527(+)